MTHNDGNGMSKEEIAASSNVLIIGGSETTGTLLSGATYLLCRHPSYMAKLQDEVRENFAREEEMSFKALADLTYLNAILQESLRVRLPLPEHHVLQYIRENLVTNMQTIVLSSSGRCVTTFSKTCRSRTVDLPLRQEPYLARYPRMLGTRSFANVLYLLERV